MITSHLEPVVSDEVAERAHDLLERNAVCLVTGFQGRAAVVNGRTAWYTVRAYAAGVTCECTASEGGRMCSHKAAAMVLWAES